MSAKTQPIGLLSAAALPPSASFYQVLQSPVSVPNSQMVTRTFPVVVATGTGPFTSYPPPHEDKDDEHLLHTYASFHAEPITELCCHDTNHNGTWTLSLAVPLPEIDNPTLLSLRYMVKYATTCDNGNATIQTDTVLTTKSLPEGVITKTSDLSVYREQTAGYGPRMVDHNTGLCLTTTLAVKSNGPGEHWNHYIDNQHLLSHVRVVEESQLYFFFHVCEYPTVRTVRALSVEVSATWQKVEVEKKAKEEVERKAREEEVEKAKEKAAREAREAEERQARQEEKQFREEQRQWWRENSKAQQIYTTASAPAVADDAMQSQITEAMNRLGLEACPSGLAYEKTSFGYQCTGGGHKITWAQLGMK